MQLSVNRAAIGLRLAAMLKLLEGTPAGTDRACVELVVFAAAPMQDRAQ